MKLKSFIAVALSVLSLSACSQNSADYPRYDTSDVEGSVQYLLDLTIANFAPESLDDFNHYFNSCEDLFVNDSDREAFFNYEEKKDNLVLGINLNSFSAIYSVSDSLGKNYRITLDLVQGSSTETVDVYYLMNNEGKIRDVSIVKGGSTRV